MPDEVAVKVALIEQCIPAARRMPHVVVTAKSVALVPVAAILAMARVLLP